MCVFIHLDYTIKPRLSPTQTSNCTKAKNPKSNRIFYYNPNRKSHARTYTLFQKLTHGENFVKERKNNELLIKCSRVWGVCVCSWVDCWYDWERIWQMPNDGWMCECVCVSVALQLRDLSVFGNCKFCAFVYDCDCECKCDVIKSLYRAYLNFLGNGNS